MHVSDSSGARHDKPDGKVCWISTCHGLYGNRLRTCIYGWAACRGMWQRDTMAVLAFRTADHEQACKADAKMSASSKHARDVANIEISACPGRAAVAGARTRAHHRGSR